MVEEYFSCCLYFTASKLARVIARLAEEEFAATGLSPTYAFLLMAVCEEPGIAQQDLAARLHLTPSTVTRLLDKLAGKGLAVRRTTGKNSHVFLTAKGEEAQAEIRQAWERLHVRYAALLGREEGDRLTAEIAAAADRLNER
jgi:DNA-binding MarR family transcriptional regulator